jgi:molecular chaperone DnaK (HSP70)
MILKNIKTYSSAQAGSDIRDSVFTVPAHWGFRARQALVNAAAIADLSVLGLINENSAAAIHFAITRNDTDAVNIGFFNLGSDVLQISIIQFFGTFDAVKEKYIESMRVLSHISVPNIGGLSIDEQLASYIADEFQAKHKVDVRTNEKSWVKLLHKCSDVKETLSANK